MKNKNFFILLNEKSARLIADGDCGWCKSATITDKSKCDHTTVTIHFQQTVF
jgi:hypothetical protein